MKLFALLFVSLTAFAAERSRLLQVNLEGQTLGYVEVLKDGSAFKAYPKPRVPIGKVVKKGEREILEPSENVSDDEKFFPLVANIINPSEIDSELLEAIQSVDVDWNKLELKPVPADEVAKIQAFEKALQGKWKLAGATDSFGEVKGEILQYKDLEFCTDGSCLADGEKKFYWVDGKFLRLSFQDDEKWEKYSRLEEYDIEKLDEKTLVIRPLALPAPPSLRKSEESYPEDSLKRAYFFERR